MTARTRVAAAVAALTAAVVAGTMSTGIARAATTPVWPGYHLDAGRSGFDNAEPSFWSLRAAWAVDPTVDGTIQGQPLVYGSTVIVATENNSVYGFNVADGTPRWQMNVGTPRHSDAVCGVSYTEGITSTPVIDGTHLYVVADVEDDSGSAPSYSFRMFAFDLAQSPPAPLFNSDITPTAMRSYPGTGEDETKNHKQRTALAISNGNVVVGWGGLGGDCANYHGFLETVSESNGAPQAQWYSASEPGGRQGALWAPSGPAVDANGNIFVTTGNGSSATTYDCGNSVLQFDSSLHMLSVFAPGSPQTWQSLNTGDADLGSVGPLLLNNGLLFQIGKGGRGYLLNQASLPNVVPQPQPAGIGYCPANPVAGGESYSATVCAPYGEAAYGGAAATGNTIFVGCGDGERALRVDSPHSFHVLWRNNAVNGVPTVAGGLVWAGTLVGGNFFCGLDMASGATRVCLTLPQAPAHFESPASANGELFYADNTQLAAFAPPAIAPASATGGYVIDGYGGMHPIGGSSPAAGYGYWPPADIVRGAVLRPDRTGGLTLLDDGTVEPFGSQTPVSGAPVFPFDIARGMVLNPCDSSGGSGYVLDGFGGVHSFGGAPPVTATDYWPGWDIARAIVVNACTGGSVNGWYVDGFGGMHSFWQPGAARPASPPTTAYWPGWDIVRGAVLTGAGTGYVLDGWGGLHPFGGAPAASVSGWHWNRDSSRVVVAVSGTQGGYVLDAYGAVSPWSARGTPAPAAPPGVPGWNFPIARGLAV